jgi:hypothetical protein
MARRTMVTAARVRGLEPLSRRLDVDAAASAHPECCSLCRHGRHVKTYPTSWRSRPACRSFGSSADDPSDLEPLSASVLLGGSSPAAPPGRQESGPSEGRRRGQATCSVLVGQDLPGGQVATGTMHSGAGGTLAPARYRPLTGVPQRHQSSPGRNSSCRSMANEPPLMSPPTMLELAVSRSTGVQTRRARISSRNPGAWASMVASIRSANASPERPQSFPASGRSASPTGRAGTWV